jgi:hypothetical protein
MAVEELAECRRVGGQHHPIIVRPHPWRRMRFRLQRALQDLGFEQREAHLRSIEDGDHQQRPQRQLQRTRVLAFDVRVRGGRSEFEHAKSGEPTELPDEVIQVSVLVLIRDAIAIARVRGDRRPLRVRGVLGFSFDPLPEQRAVECELLGAQDRGDEGRSTGRERQGEQQEQGACHPSEYVGQARHRLSMGWTVEDYTRRVGYRGNPAPLRPAWSPQWRLHGPLLGERACRCSCRNLLPVKEISIFD